MKTILLVLALVTFVGCTSTTTPTTPAPAPGTNPSPTPAPAPSAACSAETAVTTGIAAAFGTTAGCTGTAAISSDIEAAVSKIGIKFCTTVTAAKQTLAEAKKGSKNYSVPNEKGVVGNVACPLVLTALETAVFSVAIPASWQCSPNATVASLIALGTTACENAISF